MRLAVIQQLPLEYYPPVTNLLTFLADDPDFEIRAFAVESARGRPRWSHPGVRVTRTSPPQPGDSFASKVRRYLGFLAATLAGLVRFRPDAILYFEPHSALPVHLYRRWLGRRTRIFVHHHEYYEPSQFERPGMRLPRLSHRCETRHLFAVAEWISQTNEARRELFLADHPGVAPERVHVLPNHPPRSWYETRNRAWGRSGEAASPLRCVYIGSLSLQDTFVEPLVAWIESTPHPVALDIHAYNVPAETARWLEARTGERIAFHPEGVPYQQLPETLADYHVGLILYRGNTTNFVWNAPNKLFEYLACDLDVWYPPVMAGVRPYLSEETHPRVLEVDYEKLDSIPFEKLCRRGTLPERRERHEAEAVYAGLAAALRGAALPNAPDPPPHP